MTKAEQKKLLEDEWPKAPKRKKADFEDVIKKASKSGLFEVGKLETDLVCS